MKKFYNRNTATEAKQENEIIITEQQWTTSYRFYTVEFDELLRNLISRKKKPFYYHEQMDPTMPVKFYIDYERDDLTSEDEHIVCALELQEIIATLINSFLPFQAEYIMLEARDSKRIKFSAHVTFYNVWCENMYSIKQHLTKIGLAEKMDVSIYSLNLPKTLRMPFACKIDGGRQMLPIVNGVPVVYFQPSLFCKALIAITTQNSTRFKHLLPEPPTEFVIHQDLTFTCEEHLCTKKIRLLPLTEEQTHMEQIANKILAWIEDFRYDVKVEIEDIEATSAGLYIRGKTKCGGGLFCEHMGKVHKHNHMKMKIMRIGKHAIRTSVQCLDEDCKHVTQSFPFDFSRLCCEVPDIVKF